MFFAGFFLCLGTALAQTEISGTVVSSEDGQPVIGASILVVGTQNGTATDIDGHFSLSAKSGSKITVSYIGMKTQTLTGKAKMKIATYSSFCRMESSLTTDIHWCSQQFKRFRDISTFEIVQ